MQMPVHSRDITPTRRARETEALKALGWHHRWHTKEGITRLRIDLPNPRHQRQRGVGPGGALPSSAADASVVLWVRFDGFPFFPPTVIDENNGLGITRHRNPNTGDLCLVEYADWHADTSVADLLVRQIPLILAANEPTAAIGEVIEAPVPEPISYWARATGPAVIVPDAPVPQGVASGALVYRVATHWGYVHSAIVEKI